MRFPSKETVERIRKEYPVGTRVELVQMDDPQAPPVGTKGTVRGAVSYTHLDVYKRQALMDGRKANLVITDPPYNVNYEGLSLIHICS